MDQTSWEALNRAVVDTNFVNIKIGSGIDTTTDKNARRIHRAYRMLMNVLIDEKRKQ